MDGASVEKAKDGNFSTATGLAQAGFANYYVDWLAIG
jgi:hypothetical protein